MNFLSARENFGPNDMARVESTHQANVRLFDDQQFARFKRGEKATFYGGFYKQFPAFLEPPHAGIWHVVVDTAGRSAFRASISIIRR